MNIRDEIALVTGSSRGLGAARAMRDVRRRDGVIENRSRRFRSVG